MTPPSSTIDEEIGSRALSVAQLTAQIKEVVEGTFPAVVVVGEVSNFSRPQSGHCYFTLKDDRAQIRSVIWRGSAARMKFDMADGLQLVCRGHLDVYAPRGSYQLVVESAEPQGVGALELKLRQLREKLGKEGLFDAERKQPLPKYPRRIGFVTSATGAAVRDFLEVLRRRWQGAEVLVIPSRVQGAEAAAELVAGIQLASRVQPALDVLVVGRGGGSIEDLWPFNEEPVIRAIAECPLPTISAVGHEIDVTLADLVADVRALTPSEAAERVVPSALEVEQQLIGYRQRLLGSMKHRVERVEMRLKAIASQRTFRKPWEILLDRARLLDELSDRANFAIRNQTQVNEQAMVALAGKLESLSPLAVLGRGYSITHDEQSGKLIRRVDELRKEQTIRTRLIDGEVISRVQEIKVLEK